MPSDKNVTVHIEQDIVALRFQAEDGREVTVDVAQIAEQLGGEARAVRLSQQGPVVRLNDRPRFLQSGIGWAGRSERIRTSGPCVPNTVLYQAELHSDT